MGIEELIKALGLEKDAAEKLRTFITDRDKTNKGKLDKVNEKLAAMEKEKKAAESAKEKFANLAKKLGFDADAEDLDDAVDAALEEFKKTAGNPTPEEIAKLKKELNTAKKEAEKLLSEKTGAEQKYSEIREKYQNGLIRQALHKALVEANVKDPDFFSEALMAKVKVGDEDEALTFIGNGGAELEIGDGIAEFAKAHPDFIASGQKGGMGTGPGNGAPNNGKNGVNPIIQELIDHNKSSGDAGKALDDFFS